MLDRITDRMLSAARLHPELYQEVNQDPSGRVQAMVAVALVAMAAGIGGGLRVAGGDFYVALTGLALGVIGYAVGWALFLMVAYKLSTGPFRLAPRLEMTRDQLLATTGFAQAPAIFSFFSFLPLIGTPLQLVIFCWVGVAAAMAVAEVMRTDTLGAAKIVVPGALVQISVYFVLLSLAYPLADFML